MSPFERHPEMLLKRSDISCFVANWDDKATNLRRIARELNIGVDSLVFLDDNPFERNLVRAELPEVSVPEVPDDDPALMPQALSDAGYFEAVSITDEDRARTGSYRANAERGGAGRRDDRPAVLPALAADAAGVAPVRPHRPGPDRAADQQDQPVQPHHATHHRGGGAGADAATPERSGCSCGSSDRFGDNGIIAVVAGRVDEAKRCHIETWLMSCRVLGRGVEQATLALLAEQARALGATELVGEYVPTAKNAMVAEHYARLGFRDAAPRPDGGHVSVLPLHDFVAPDSYMDVSEGA